MVHFFYDSALELVLFLYEGLSRWGGVVGGGGAGEEVLEVVVAEVDGLLLDWLCGRSVILGGRGLNGGVEGGFSIVDTGVLLADRGEGGGDFLVEGDGREDGGVVLVLRVGVGVGVGGVEAGALFGGARTVFFLYCRLPPISDCS